MTCPKCNDLGFVGAAEFRQPCACLVHNRVLARYPFLEAVHCKKVDLTKVKGWVQSIAGTATLDEDRLLLLDDCRPDELSVLLAWFLMAYGVTDYERVWAGELIELQFNLHPKWKSLLDVRASVVILLLGFAEVRNDMLMELVFQFWNKCRLQIPVQRLLVVANRSGMTVARENELLAFAERQQVWTAQHGKRVVWSTAGAGSKEKAAVPTSKPKELIYD